METLTAKENASKTGTFTHRSWHKLAVLEARSRFYSKNVAPEEREHPLQKLVEVARETSGAINGEFRKDLVEAAKAGQSTTLGLAVQGSKAQANEGGAKDSGGGV